MEGGDLMDIANPAVEPAQEDVIEASDGSEQDEPEALAPNIPDLNNPVELGFVEVQKQIDPEMVQMMNSGRTVQQLPAEMFRAWSKYFAPGVGIPQVHIPAEWAAFFTVVLLNPGSFARAKSFLASPAWAPFSSAPSHSTACQDSLAFALPDKCPVQTLVSCLQGDESMSLKHAQDIMDVVEDTEPPEKSDHVLESSFLSLPHTPQVEGTVEALDSALSPTVGTPSCVVSPSTGPWSKALLAEAGKLRLSEDDPLLRRSCRMKTLNKGYKNSGCKDKQCLACDAVPPSIPPSIIKNLGADFCKIEEEKLTEAALLRKKKATAPGGKRPMLKKKSKDSNGDDKDKETKKKVKK
ncbi:unnamed protein product [Urochloa humidicola]